MKKFLPVIILLMLSPMALSVNDMPDAPEYPKASEFQANTGAKTLSGNYTSSSTPVSTVVKQMADNLLRSGSNSPELQMQLMQMGVQGLGLEVIEACPIKKVLDPIRIDGKTFSGKKCAIVRYIYNDKEHAEGSCQ